MRKLFALAAITVAALTVGLQSARAGLVGMPMGLRATVERIKFDTPTLAPMAYTEFCLKYEGECRSRPIFRGGPVKLSVDRLADLIEVNRSVNRSIIPEPNDLGLAAEKWLIGPDRGDCNDYAVTKRHELLARGWPARALLLSEVVVRGGEHHLVLTVRTKSGDLVMDNLTPQIKPWSRVPYRWVRVQLPTNARLWTTIADRGV